MSAKGHMIFIYKVSLRQVSNLPGDRSLKTFHATLTRANMQLSLNCNALKSIYRSIVPLWTWTSYRALDRCCSTLVGTVWFVSVCVTLGRYIAWLVNCGFVFMCGIHLTILDRYAVRISFAAQFYCRSVWHIKRDSPWADIYPYVSSEYLLLA